MTRQTTNNRQHRTNIKFEVVCTIAKGGILVIYSLFKRIYETSQDLKRFHERNLGFHERNLLGSTRFHGLKEISGSTGFHELSAGGSSFMRVSGVSRQFHGLLKAFRG